MVNGKSASKTGLKVVSGAKPVLCFELRNENMSDGFRFPEYPCARPHPLGFRATVSELGARGK